MCIVSKNLLKRRPKINQSRSVIKVEFAQFLPCVVTHEKNRTNIHLDDVTCFVSFFLVLLSQKFYIKNSPRTCVLCGQIQICPRRVCQTEKTLFSCLCTCRHIHQVYLFATVKKPNNKNEQESRK